MSKAIVVSKPGGPEVFQMQNFKLNSKLGPDDILIKHTHIGVNYIDVYYRSGLYPINNKQAIPGVEAVGVVEDFGDNVQGLRKGSKIIYFTPEAGAYCDRRIIHQQYAVSLPGDIREDVACATYMKAMTAHMLLLRVLVITREHTILIHSAAGAVGQIMCQWARHLGATVIGTVGSPERVSLARKAGAQFVIDRSSEDVVRKVMEYTKNVGVNVAYDSVGKDTFTQTIQSLTYLGMAVSYGQSSGPVPPFDLALLAHRSNFLTRPSVFTYKGYKMEVILTATEIFELLRRGVLNVPIAKRFPFSVEGVRQLHQDLQGRKLSGSCVIEVQ